jgi:hypothetical protein
MWYGISCDEVKRVRTSDCAWLKHVYPLIFMVRMWRLDCVAHIREKGWTDPIPSSACWMCANASDEEWLDMKQNWPDDFRAACRLETEAQIKDPHFWLHPSCQPLATVDFGVQQSMFPDRGCMGGCLT